ncbi:MAG: pseudomurein-binding repeat-containing protein [Methanobacterium sp.]
MGIGGGIITRKLLLTVFLIASLSLGGFSTASAAEQGTVKTQTSNINTDNNNINTQQQNSNILKETAKTQKKADESVKKVEKTQTEKQVTTSTKTEATVTSTKPATTINIDTSTTQENTVSQVNPVTTDKTQDTTTTSSTTNKTADVPNTITANTVSAPTTTVEAKPEEPVTTQNTIDNSLNASNSSVNNKTTATQATQTATQNTSSTEEYAAAGNTYTDVNGIWLKAEDVGKVSVSELVNANVTDIFVKTNLLSSPKYQTVLSEVVSKFQNTGIRIHTWITCFKDANGNWVDPANATQRTFLLNSITDIAKNYGVDGIHLDYVRYSGVGDNAAYNHANATETITTFVHDVWKAVKAINPDIAVSTAVMPEGANNARIYGQDYAKLAQYVDFLVPMVYKGNYGQNTTWIGTSIKYIADQVGEKPVIAGLQTYVSDYDTTQLPASELNQDINSAIDNGASGYALFRYGTISQDFLNPPSFTVKQISDAANRVKSYIDANKRLPNFVTINSTQVSISEFLKLMTKSLIQINSGITTPIKLSGVSYPAESTGSFTTGSINKTEYMDIAKRINAFMDADSNAPNYATTSLGKIKYESVIYMFSKTLGFYNTYSNLPSYVSMDSAVKVSSAKNESSLTVFSLAQIQKAATNVKKYIEANHKLPNYVTVGTTQIKVTDFLRLMVIGTTELNKGVKMPISLKSVNGPSTPTESIKSGNLTKADYLNLADRLKAFIDANGSIPKHATTTLGEMKYQSFVYLFAKILSFEDKNSRLPSSVSVKSWSTVSAVITSSDPVPASLQKYLAATANCQVNNAQIKALAAKITAGKTTTYAKAAAIFNWVRDNLSYSFYYNTKYGAVGSLNARTGNCVDTSHLIVALERAAGIPARYKHVYARFTSGHWYGHVVAQVYVNGKWYTADGTSSRNSFGVVNNWGSATVKGIYASLPF